MKSMERRFARWTIWRKTFAETPDRFVINMIGDGPPLVLDPKQVEAARERIKTRYNVITGTESRRTARRPAPATDQKKG